MIDPKNISTKKFIIFMAVAFGAAMIPLCLAGVMLNKGNTLAFMLLFRVVAVCVPAVAVIVSGSGFKNLGFKPHKIGLIPVALVIPQILTWIGTAIYFMFFPDAFRPGFDAYLSQLPSELSSIVDYSSIDPMAFTIAMAVMSLTVIPISQILPSFGEEAGWRGVLYPFLKERLGKTLGRIIGGILWGVWHWPLILIGNYFYGNGYPGFPFLGPVMICVALMAYGVLIDWLYEKTGSIIVPSIAHAAMNAAAMPVMLLSNVQDSLLGPAAFTLIPVIPVIVVAVVILITDRSRKVNA